MGTAPDRDYDEGKEWFTQQTEPLPLYVQILNFLGLLGGGTVLAIFAFIALSLTVGCANVTVTQLADRCYANGGKASVTFAGDTGKVNCQ